MTPEQIEKSIAALEKLALAFERIAVTYEREHPALVAAEPGSADVYYPGGEAPDPQSREEYEALVPGEPHFQKVIRLARESAAKT
jgi:hypothetical protein